MDLVEILKNAPNGLKLYSPLVGECELDSTEEKGDYPIFTITHDTDYTLRFSKEGTFFVNDGLPYGECLLFPSKECHTWEAWQMTLLKLGDIVAFVPQQEVRIPVKISELTRYAEFVYSCSDGQVGTRGVEYFDFATEEEKQKFEYEQHKNEQFKQLKFKHQLNAFDKVLVRDANDCVWEIDIFGRFSSNDEKYPYICIGGNYAQCILYNEETAHLIGTTNTFNGG